MKKNKNIITALIVSIALHAVFFVGATKIKFSGAKVNDQEAPRNFRIKKLHSVIPERRSIEAMSVQYDEQIKFQKPAQWEVSEENYDKFKAAKKDTVVQNFDEKIQELFTSQEQEYLLDEQQRFKDFSNLKRGAFSTKSKAIIEISQVTKENFVAKPQEVVDTEIVPEEFFDKMPGFTPKWNPMVRDIASTEDVGVIERNYQPLVTKKSRFTDLKEYLVSEILTYEDPKTSEKYFQINMKVGKDAGELKTISKEIVFLIDCSKSTTEKRFRQFKKGLEYSLKSLNPGDKFNILAFKKFIIDFQPESVEPTKENIRKALFFVDRLTLGTKTNAYNALFKSMSRPMQINPSYIIFLSDGYPTQGVTDPRRIINEVSELNNGSRSIFAFSGGLNVNRYLLDFITYKNRGWSEYSYRSHLIGKYLSQMYDKIKDPLLVNVRYHASGLNEDQIFPKLLPDFFRNVEFSLYGKYEDENEFVLQMIGDVKGKVTEYFVEAALKDAAKGDESVAKNWAFNKIYDLIGQLKDDDQNMELISQIETLSKRYKIKTPYLKKKR